MPLNKKLYPPKELFSKAPIGDIIDARIALRNLPNFVPAGKERIKALGWLRQRAFLSEKPDEKVVGLIERMRERELKKLPSGKTLQKILLPAERAVAVQLFFVEGIILGKKKGDAIIQLKKIEQFVKKNHCEKPAAKLLEDFSERIKKQFEKTASIKKQRLFREVIFESLELAIGLNNNTKNTAESARLLAKHLRLKKLLGISE